MHVPTLTLTLALALLPRAHAALAPRFTPGGPTVCYVCPPSMNTLYVPYLSTTALQCEYRDYADPLGGDPECSYSTFTGTRTFATDVTVCAFSAPSSAFVCPPTASGAALTSAFLADSILQCGYGAAAGTGTSCPYDSTGALVTLAATGPCPLIATTCGGASTGTRRRAARANVGGMGGVAQRRRTGAGVGPASGAVRRLRLGRGGVARRR